VCDLICDVVTCCVLSYDMGKINVCDKIMIENQKNMEIKEIFLHAFSSKRSITNGIHSLLKRADVRVSEFNAPPDTI